MAVFSCGGQARTAQWRYAERFARRNGHAGITAGRHFVRCIYFTVVCVATVMQFVNGETSIQIDHSPVSPGSRLFFLNL
jgi:hypothetical protein